MNRSGSCHATDRDLHAACELDGCDCGCHHVVADLRSAREHLCRASTWLDTDDIDLITAAIGRVDLVGMSMDGWSKRDRPGAWWDLPPEAAS